MVRHLHITCSKEAPRADPVPMSNVAEEGTSRWFFELTWWRFSSLLAKQAWVPRSIVLIVESQLFNLQEAVCVKETDRWPRDSTMALPVLYLVVLPSDQRWTSASSPSEGKRALFIADYPMICKISLSLFIELNLLTLFEGPPNSILLKGVLFLTVLVDCAEFQ